MPHRVESFQLLGEAMALLAGITLMHAFFSQPGYGQLRQAIENAPIGSRIGGLFDKFADLQGADVPLHPVENLWDLVLSIRELLQATGNAR
jgi:hypothetical protein